MPPGSITDCQLFVSRVRPRFVVSKVEADTDIIQLERDHNNHLERIYRTLDAERTAEKLAQLQLAKEKARWNSGF